VWWCLKFENWIFKLTIGKNSKWTDRFLALYSFKNLATLKIAIIFEITCKNQWTCTQRKPVYNELLTWNQRFRCGQVLLYYIHTRKKSAIPPADVDFGMWKTVIITKSLRNFCQTQNSSQNQRTYISVLELFHIKFVFISFSLLYARKVDLFDKIEAVVFSQLFPCVFSYPYHLKNV
jgi:hypothetical protein